MSIIHSQGALTTVQQGLDAFVDNWANERRSRSLGPGYDQELEFAVKSFTEAIQAFLASGACWTGPLPDLVAEGSCHWHGRGLALLAGSYLLNENTKSLGRIVIGGADHDLASQHETRRVVMDFILRMERKAYEDSLLCVTTRERHLH